MSGPVDLHVHLLGASPALGNRFTPSGLGRLAVPWVKRRYGAPHSPLGSAWADRRMASGLREQLRTSGLAGAVLLALDGPHDSDGRAVPGSAPLKVGNRFAQQVAAPEPARLRFGASVHPYRPDAVPRLEALVEAGAALVKWLPSYQGIDLNDRRCHAIYELLAQHGVPLLVHTGLEHTLRGGRQDLNHPRHLEAPLAQGVTVVAAHCGLRLFLYEPCWGAAWAELARRWERCYGDLSACWNPVRLWRLARWLEQPEIASKLVYGSDFPAAPGWAWMSRRPGLTQGSKASRESNPLARSLAVARAAGVSEDILARGGTLLPPMPEASPCTSP